MPAGETYARLPALGLWPVLAAGLLGACSPVDGPLAVSGTPVLAAAPGAGEQVSGNSVSGTPVAGNLAAGDDETVTGPGDLYGGARNGDTGNGDARDGDARDGDAAGGQVASRRGESGLSGGAAGGRRSAGVTGGASGGTAGPAASSLHPLPPRWPGLAGRGDGPADTVSGSDGGGRATQVTARSAGQADGPEHGKGPESGKRPVNDQGQVAALTPGASTPGGPVSGMRGGSRPGASRPAAGAAPASAEWTGRLERTGEPEDSDRWMTRPLLAPPLAAARLRQGLASAGKPCRQAVTAARHKVEVALTLPAARLKEAGWKEEALRATGLAALACSGGRDDRVDSPRLAPASPASPASPAPASPASAPAVLPAAAGEAVATYWRGVAFALHGQYGRAAVTFRRLAVPGGVPASPYSSGLAGRYVTDVAELLEACGVPGREAADRPAVETWLLAGLLEVRGEDRDARALYARAGETSCEPLHEWSRRRLASWPAVPEEGAFAASPASSPASPASPAGHR